MDAKRINELLKPLGLKPLNKIWAKIEIFLGLSCVFFSLVVVFSPNPDVKPFGTLPREGGLVGLLTGLALFVLGGYLAMAGHRSHSYQSNNQLTAFLVEEIRKVKGNPP